MEQTDFQPDRIPEEKLKFQIDWKNEIKTAFLNGKLFNGVAYITYPSGKLKHETPYVNGKKHGLEKSYFENGTLKAESACANGIDEGRARGWHENGQLAYDWLWQNRQPEGSWKTWNEDGSLKREKIYVEGKLLSHKEY